MHFLTKAFGHVTKLHPVFFKAKVGFFFQLVYFLQWECCVILPPNKDGHLYLNIFPDLQHIEVDYYTRNPIFLMTTFRFLSMLLA